MKPFSESELKDTFQKNFHILEFFDACFKKNQLANAYILNGESSLEEKQNLSLEINKILNCKHNISKSLAEMQTACNECDSCTWLMNKEHPKTPLILGREESSKTIKVATVQKLQEQLSQSSPYFRVIVIPEADFQVFSKHPANALLKSIEEPHPRSLFLLFSRSKYNVLGTIKSRCQVINIEPEHEENIGADEKTSKILEIYEKYKTQHDDFSPQIKNKLFIEEIAKFTKEELINYFDYNISKIQISKESICFIESLEEAKLKLNSYVNPKAVLNSIEFFS